MAKIIMEGVVTPGSIARLEFQEADVGQVLEALASLGFRRGVNAPTEVVVQASEAPAALIQPAPVQTGTAPPPPKPPKAEVPAPSSPAPEKKAEPKVEPPAPPAPEVKQPQLELEPPPAPEKKVEPPPAAEEKPAKRKRRAEADEDDAAEEKPASSGPEGFDRGKVMEMKRLRDVVEYAVKSGIKDPDAVVALCVELRDKGGHKPLQRTPDMEKRAKALAEAASVEA